MIGTQNFKLYHYQNKNFLDKCSQQVYPRVLGAIMSLRKNPMTPARLQANRRNSQKSTGPRSARGKSQSRLNRLRGGGRSRLYEDSRRPWWMPRPAGSSNRPRRF